MKLVLTKAQNLRNAIDETFKQIKNQTGKICIIVPDKLSVTLEKKLFEYLNIDCSFDIEISTLTRFSQKILTELNIEYSQISKLGSIILIKKLLNENNSELKMFNSPSFSYNYSDALFKTLTQFKASKISSNDIIFEKPTSKQLENKLLDIKLILEKYENEKAGLIDQCDRLNLLSANIHKSNIIKNTSFHFVGFSDFTTQGYYVIEQLIKNAISVNVCCYDTKSNNKILYSNEVFSHLLNLAYSLDFPYEVIDNNYTDDELHTFLVNNTFANTNTHFDLKNDEIQIFNGKTIEEEVDFVLRDIRTKILNGENYYNFGIACFELEKYTDLIKALCEKYELNYYIDSSCSLSSTIYFKFLYNFIKLYADNFKLDNIVEFVNSPFVPIDMNKKILLNKFLREINFSGNINYLPEIENLQEEILYLKDLFKNFKFDSNTSITNIKDNFTKLELMLNIGDKLEEFIEKSSSLYNKKILTQAKSSMESVLNEIEKFYPVLNLDEFLDIVQSAGAEQKIMPIPQSIDCIQIIDANEILTDFENLYIINCTRSNAPQITQDIGIILDSNIINLPFQKKLTPTIAHLNKMSKFKLFNSFQMFNKTLTITMSIFNESQKSDLVKELETKITNNNNHLNLISSEDYLQSYKVLSKWDLIEFLSSNYSTENNKILTNYDVKPYEKIEYLDNATISKINFNEISCSALENYYKCPMMYFFNNTLKLQEERQSGIAMVDVGNMLHQLAQDFYKVANRYSLDILEFSKTKLSNYMSEDNKLKVYLNSPIHINLIKEGVRFLEHLKYLDENSQFNPTFFEYSFDSNFSKSIPLTNEVFLRGKIDRIDFYENYVRIIDYKTGSVTATLKDLYYGKKLQLFLYGQVAQKIFNKTLAGTFYLPIKNSILSDENIVPYKLTGFYQNNNDLKEIFDKRINTTLKSDIVNLSLNKDGNIKTDARSNKVLLPTQFNNLLNYAVDISKNAIDEIKQGYIAPNPIKYDEVSSSCNYCKYLPICRRNSMNINYRTTKNINLDSFGGEQNG